MLYLALPGIWEMVPILVVLLVLFGAKKLPELARAMGSSINMFKKGLADGDEGADELPPRTPPPRVTAGKPPAREAEVEDASEPGKERLESGEKRAS